MKNFQRIFGIISKTGDRYIFEDEQENSFVVLTLEDYEHLVLGNSQVKGLSEEELLNKINKDIALWKVAQQEELAGNIIDLPDEGEQKDEDRYYFEPADDEE